MTMTTRITLITSSGDWTTASECNPGDVVATESGKAYLVAQLPAAGRIYIQTDFVASESDVTLPVRRIGRVEVGVRDENCSQVRCAGADAPGEKTEPAKVAEKGQ